MKMLFTSVEYPASLLQGWKTSPKTVNDNMIYQVVSVSYWSNLKNEQISLFGKNV